MKILVTGGAGFIGSHVVRTFLDAGHEVLIVDDLSSGKQENVPEGVRLVLADIRSETAVEAVRTFKPEVFCHHAAQIDVRRSVADPLYDTEVNVLGTIRLLMACRDAGVRKVLFASSGGAGYGEPDGYARPDEDHPLRPVSPYGAAKMSIDLYLRVFREQYGLDYTSLRYANVYGPRQNPHGEAGVVAIFLDRLLTGKTAVINGDGCQTRDYVYAGDIARANLLALEKGGGLAINIGTGVETDVNTLFRLLQELTGNGQREVHGPPSAGEQRRSVLENRLASEALGWYPSVSLAEGLANTVAFFRDRLSRTSGW